MDRMKEEKYFHDVVQSMSNELITLKEGIEYRKKAILAQKKYMRDSHGDMDDEEFLQNMNNVNNDAFFIEHAAKQLHILKRHIKSPYFGKVIFRYQEDGETLPVYIGMHGYTDNHEQLIFDWRAPISSVYYDFDRGQASYKALDGVFDGEVLEKCQFDISQGNFHSVVETDEQINDRILLAALSNNSDVHMKSVVATIQKEQNKIIRNDTAYNLIVDGRAGSGKTVIAMHRLAWLLFQHKNLKNDNVLILSPNGIFGDYIAGVLPELGEDNVPEKEFDALMDEILFVDCAYETRLEQAEAVIEEGRVNSSDTVRGRIDNLKEKSSVRFFDALNEYLCEYEEKMVFKDFHFEKTEFAKEKIEKMFRERFARYPLYMRFEKMAYFIADRVMEEKNMRENDDVRRKLEKQISRTMIYEYAERNLVNLYRDFLHRYDGSEYCVTEDGRICYEDILPVFYLQLYFYGCDTYKNIRHLVLDEMQDYTIFQFAIINRIFQCKKTILGDKLQVLDYHPQETVVDILEHVLNTGHQEASYELVELNTNYRSTSEITQYCNQIIERKDIANGGISDEHACSFDRHGKIPEEYTATSFEDALAYLTEKLLYGDMDGYENIAILCDDERTSYELYHALSEETQVTYLTNQSTVYSGGLVVMPKFLAKGMEFDAVFVLNCGNGRESAVSRHAFYIACSRALHELHIINNCL